MCDVTVLRYEAGRSGADEGEPMRAQSTESSDGQARVHEVLRALAVGVQALRIERGMTLAGLAFEAGLSEATIRAVESSRGGPTVSTLVAIADALDVGVADLFGDAVHIRDETPPAADERPSASPQAVSSDVAWGGDLPPAPWMGASAPAPEASSTDAAPERPSPTEVTWGGALPPAPWTATPVVPPSVYGVVPPAPSVYGVPSAPSVYGIVPPAGTTVPPGYTVVPTPHAAAWASPPGAPTPRTAGPLPQAAPSDGRRPVAAHAVNPGTTQVFVGAEPAGARGPRPLPRTFADLRTGPLAGRTFTSLRQFAVASVIEAGHPVTAVARVFRVPSWRLEAWVAEAGGVVG